MIRGEVELPLGFKENYDWDERNKVGDTAFGRSKDFAHTHSELAALIKDGKVVSQTALDYHDTIYDVYEQYVSSTQVRSIIQRKGYGTELYKNILEHIWPLELRPDIKQSDAGRALWESLKLKDFVEVTETGIKLKK